MKKLLLIFFLLHALMLTAQVREVKGLTCEYKINPLGIERAQPAFGWQMTSPQRGVMQTAYRIIVSDDSMLLEKNTGNMWDSEKVASDASVQVKYNGKPLKPATVYYWKVQVWDNKKQAPVWSESALWQMGLTADADWMGARWIAYEKMHDSLRTVPAEHGRGSANMPQVKPVLPILRKTFSLNKPVKRATAFICGLGHFELSINGRKTGDHFLDPGWTQYEKEAQYVVFDVTTQLKHGGNAIGVMLGNGFYFIPRQRYRKLTGAYGFPVMIMRMLIEYADGTTENIISDESWKASAGPITFSSIYGGEDYNANLEQEGWNTAGFNDAQWKQAVISKGPPVLYAQLQEPLKFRIFYSGREKKRINDSVWVYDLQHNSSGIPHVFFKGRKGDTVRIVPGELLKEDGTVSQRATGSPYYFEYILKGVGIESCLPRFSYYGFRYIQVERAAAKGEANPRELPEILDVYKWHTTSDAPLTGDFACSNDLFNRTDDLIRTAISSNMASVLTDCPHREKLGWLEQTHLMGNSIRYNYDMAAFFRKTVRDMMAAQDERGVVPEYVPEYVKMPFMDSIFMDSPEWGSASIILPWYLYQWYGDTATLQESYGMMKKYLQHLQRKSKDHILAYGLSDWYDLGPNKPGLAQLTPMGITATAIYYYDLQIMAKAAALLGRPEDGKAYSALAVEVRNAFNKTFFNKDSLQYGTGSQTANAMAVYFGLVDPIYKSAVVENIIRDIRSRNNSLTAGDVGFRYLLKVLDEAGRSDVIFDMNNRTDVPGYGYQLAKGATALTESWQALPTVSNNHLMLGHLMEWFYTSVGGISQPENSIAFRKIIIRPQMLNEIDTGRVMHKSPYGMILSHWKREKEFTNLRVEIPANTTATVYLPTRDMAAITEGGKPLFTGYLISASVENGHSLLTLGSGEYNFKIKNASLKRRVSHEKMQQVYEEIKTPHKYGLVMVPPNDSLKIDCPGIFRKDSTWYMVYLTFGGRGYETWLAKSPDLLNWQSLGRLMSFSQDTTEWDVNQKAGYISLQDPAWGGSYELKKHRGKYWMSYFGGNARGYEAGLLSIGMAHTDKDPTVPHEWKRLPKPVLTSNDQFTRWWENRKLFKSTVIHDRDRRSGHNYIMYYNANGDSAANDKRTRWFERIGMAVSDDMVTWKRAIQEPLVHHPIGITGDPYIQKIGDVWVMFYFGAFWHDRKGGFNRFAVSHDLLNWTDWEGENLVQSSEPYDELYAHKSFVVKHNGVVYHFYCAVNKKDQRGIAVATSKDLGKSKLNFVSK